MVTIDNLLIAAVNFELMIIGYPIYTKSVDSVVKEHPGGGAHPDSYRNHHRRGIRLYRRHCAEPVSSTKPLPKDQAPELRMTEADFTAAKGLDAVEWLEKDVWEVIKQSKTTEELVGNTERFGIPFPNSVTIAKGTILRQRALIERELLVIAKSKLKAGTGTEAAVAAAERRYAAARKAFCTFLAKARWLTDEMLP